MRDLDQLVADATRSAVNRGHTLEWRYRRDTGQAVGRCPCGALVSVNTSPPPNGIDIGGDAVAVNHPTRSLALVPYRAPGEIRGGDVVQVVDDPYGATVGELFTVSDAENRRGLYQRGAVEVRRSGAYWGYLRSELRRLA